MSREGLKRLKVWCEAEDLALQVYQTILPILPPEEKWALTSQLRRSVTSIAANIAEGYGRFYYLSNIQFCYNARGSLEETIRHILFSLDCGYISSEKAEPILKKADALVLLINGYIAYLRKAKLDSGETTANDKVREDRIEYYPERPSGELEGFDESLLSTLYSQA